VCKDIFVYYHAAVVMHPCNSNLYLGTRSGEILRISINSYLANDVTEKPMLCGRHRVGQPVINLLTVTGQLSPHNFVEGFGITSCKANNKPCKVLLSIGGGYTELIPCSELPERFSAEDLCMIAFLL